MLTLRVLIVACTSLRSVYPLALCARSVYYPFSYAVIRLSNFVSAV